MLLDLIQTQSISLMIIILFLIQKNRHLEKIEVQTLLIWQANLLFVNFSLLFLTQIECSSLEILMLASMNGLASIVFLFLQKTVLREVCFK